MRYEATAMGERVTQLYLDPLSASILRKGLRRAVRRAVRMDGPVTDFGLLHLAVATPDFTFALGKVVRHGNEFTDLAQSQCNGI